MTLKIELNGLFLYFNATQFENICIHEIFCGAIWGDGTKKNHKWIIFHQTIKHSKNNPAFVVRVEKIKILDSAITMLEQSCAFM